MRPQPDSGGRTQGPIGGLGRRSIDGNGEPEFDAGEWSFHFDQFERTRSRRNTLDRFDELGVPADVTDRTVVVVGTDLSGVSFECLRRGARRVVGWEPSSERAAGDRQLAESLRLGDRCEFRAVDLRGLLDNPDQQADIVERYGRSDVVFCSVSDSDTDWSRLAQFLSRVTSEIGFLETTSRVAPRHLAERMTEAGFVTVNSLPRGWFDYRQHRRTFVLDRKMLLSERREQRRYRGYRLSERYLKDIVPIRLWRRISNRYLTPNSRYDHRSYSLGDRYIRDFASIKLWYKVRRLYQRIAHIPYVQECEFPFPGRLTSPMYSHDLLHRPLTPEETAWIRPQVVMLVKMLNQAGVAHRDLHCNNIFLDGGRIRLIDLEFLEDDPRPLSQCYDMTGEGLEVPLKSGAMNVFKDFDRSLMHVLGLTRRDFGLFAPGDVLPQDADWRAA